MFLAPVSIEGVTNMTQGLKKSAPVHDDIATEALTLRLPSITYPLVYILNLSLSQGVFPDELKIANVIPLYKADDRMCFNNYLYIPVITLHLSIVAKNGDYMIGVFLDFSKAFNIVDCDISLKKFTIGC